MEQPKICCDEQDPYYEDESIMCASCGVYWTEKQLDEFNQWLASKGYKTVTPERYN